MCPPPPGLIGLKDNSNLKHCCFYLRRFPSIALRILSAHHLITFLACARAHAPSELGRFSLKTEQLREITSRFLLNELSDPHFLIHKFKWHMVEYNISLFQEKLKIVV